MTKLYNPIGDLIEWSEKCTVKTYTWEQAMAGEWKEELPEYANDEWRLPLADELVGFFDYLADQWVNDNFYDYSFWSGSPWALEPRQAWSVSATGDLNHVPTSRKFNVVLVRCIQEAE